MSTSGYNSIAFLSDGTITLFSLSSHLIYFFCTRFPHLINQAQAKNGRKLPPHPRNPRRHPFINRMLPLSLHHQRPHHRLLPHPQNRRNRAPSLDSLFPGHALHTTRDPFLQNNRDELWEDCCVDALFFSLFIDDGGEGEEGEREGGEE